jgi:hypothetical protein
VSSEDELERILREGWTRLPDPGTEVTNRTRAAALAAVRRKRRGLRLAVTLVALVVAVGIGVGVGAIVAPSGTAARPIGLGFMPAPGWKVLEAAAPSMEGQPEVAMSANVPFAREDVLLGFAEPSGLPYSTLLTLPSNGIVIIATFTEQDRLFLPRITTPSGKGVPRLYPERALPFHIRDATPFIQYGTQVRPEEPLGQYQLRASLEDWYVDVHVYFGTPRPSPARLAEAQRGLDRMVVRTALLHDSETARPATNEAVSAPAVLDRTYRCTPSIVGGVNKLYVLASKGTGRRGPSWERPAFAGVRTNISGSAATAIDNYLIWVGAGRPTAAALVPHAWRIQLFEFPFRVWGTIAVNRTRCRASTARVPLTGRALTGGPAGVFPDEFDCTTPKAVLIRVRAVTQSSTTLRSYRSFIRTAVPVTEAAIAVQTPSGKRLAFAKVGKSGMSRILVAQPPCYPN